MKLLVVYGSPDDRGNSNRLSTSLVKAASDEGARVEEININDYRISNVWKNYFADALANNFERAGDDDMTELKQKMINSDIVVLVSPVYWYQLCGALKTFVDRWTDLLNPDFTSELAGKGLALVTTHSGLNVMNSSNYLQLAMHATAEFLGMKWMGGVESNTKLPFNEGPIDAYQEIAGEFGKKLARGENLIGLKELTELDVIKPA